MVYQYCVERGCGRSLTTWHPAIEPTIKPVIMHHIPTPVQDRFRLLLLISGLMLIAQLGGAQNYITAPLYGTNGMVPTAFTTDPYAQVIMARQHLTPQGWQIIGATMTLDGGSNSIRLTKMDAYCGAPDPTFGATGQQTFGMGYQTHLNDMAVLDDDRIAVAGMNATGNGLSEIQPTIFLFRADGSLDTSFNHTGYNKMAIWPPSADIGHFFSVIPSDDGKLYAIGATGYDPGFSAAGVGVMRFDLDGTLDTTYSDDGITWASGPAGGITLNRGDAILHADGKITVAEITGTQIALMRFNADGTPDIDFGTNGTLVTTMTVGSGYFPFVEMEEQDDGRLLVSTQFNGFSISHMGRFTADGELDTSYGIEGISDIFVLDNGYVHSRGILIDPEGNTLQSVTWENSGSFTHYIVKRDANGAPFAGFGTNGVFTIPDSPNMSLFDIAMPDEDHILLGGGSGGSINAVRLTTSLDAERLVILGSDTSACPGSELVITPLQANGVGLEWTGGTTGPTLAVSASGSYEATAYTIGGCSQSDMIVVNLAGPGTPLITFVDNELNSSLTGELQWFLDGDVIAGASQATYTPTENGEYTVVLTDANGCSSTSDPFLLQNVGINALRMAAPEIQVFPNPANDQVYVQLPSSGSTGYQLVTLVDNAGRTVLRTRLQAGTVVPQRIDLSQVVPGCYVLMFGGEQDNNMYPVRLVKY